MRAIYLLLLVVAATTHAASATGPDTLEALITRSETRCRQLAGKLQGCRAAGQDIALPDADLAVAQLFCRYSRYDAGQEKLRPAALRSMRYVDRLLTEQLARADRVLARKARYPRVPQYPAQGITWHNSGFWSGRRPVFLTGANWDAAEAQHDPGILHRLGFTLTDGMFRGSVRRDGSFDDDPFRMGDGRYLGLMDRAGFAVDCLTDASPPDWLVRETPGLAQRGYGNGFGYVFEHPQARGFQDRLLGHLAPVYADHPSVFAVDLANEPAFQGPSDLMLANWRAWLRRKYGTPQRLSRAWGIPMGSFDEVRRYPSQPEVMNGQWGRAAVDFGKPGVRGMHYDWCAFNNQRISAYFRSLSDRIHAGASRLATHVKMMLGLYFTGSTESRGWKMGLSYHTFGLDPEALARSLSLLGGDVDLVDLSEVPRPNRRFGSSPYVMGWLDASLAADFLKSLAPNKPYYDSELHLIEDSKPEVDPANSEAHLRAALWLSHLHGMSGNLLWYWSRDAQGAPMGTDWFAGSLLQQPWALRAYAEESLSLRHFVPQVMAFSKGPRPVRLLYSEASAIQDVGYLDCLRDTYEALNFQGLPAGFVTERQLAERGVPAGTRLVIVPNARYVQDTTRPALRLALRRGVKVALVGDACLTETPTGRRRAAAPLVGTLASPLGTPRSYAARLPDWFRAAGVSADLLALDAASRPAWGVETRAARVGRQRLAYLINLSRLPARVRLRWRQPGATPRDLRTGAAIPDTLTLRPRQLVFATY